MTRFSAIGDIVLTTPIIRCLQQQGAGEIHFLTKKRYATLLQANPYLTKIWTIEKEITEIIEALKQERFEYHIDLHKNLRTLRLRLALRVPTYTFNKLNLEKWLMVNFKINRLPSVHIVERYFEAIAPLGIKNDQQGLDYFIPPTEQVNIPVLLPSTTGYIAFAIGAAHATKRLPTAKIIDICQQIRQPIILLGGKAEAETGKIIHQKAGRHVVNCCGQLSLHQSASVIQQAHKVITHDTGMMHIAAAFHKTIISIWGNTIPAFGMSPYLPSAQNAIIEAQTLSCRPCSKIGFKKCPKGHFNCMEQIDVTNILQHV